MQVNHSVERSPERAEKLTDGIDVCRQTVMSTVRNKELVKLDDLSWYGAGTSMCVIKTNITKAQEQCVLGVCNPLPAWQK